MLAKNPRTPRGVRKPALSLETIASKLAPTGGVGKPQCFWSGWMDIDFTAHERAFREDVRAFLRDHLPVEFAERIALGSA